MITLILVRHGFSDSNKSNRFAGRWNVPLTDIGIEQSKLVCDYIVNNFKVDAIYSSPLSRTIDTIKGVSEQLSIPLNLEKQLIEVDGGDWEGVSFEDIAKRDPEFFAEWWKNKGVVRCPNGESMGEAGLRAFEFIKKLCNDKENDGKTIVLASHGGVIRSLQCIFEGITMENFDQTPWAPNASISIIKYQDGKFNPVEFGIVEHLGDLSTNLENV